VGEKRGRLQLLRTASSPLVIYQQGNKDIALFLINPKIIAIPKQIRVRKCKKIQILLLLLGNGKSEKTLRDDLKPPVMKFLYN
jgi:hypothetical protein